jgi:hypothetical protein
MTKVKSCSVENCFYWDNNNKCCAEAINVGAGHPTCDTFHSGGHHANQHGMGGVGACKVSECRYNNELFCNAPAIQVVGHAEHADCQTFSPR